MITVVYLLLEQAPVQSTDLDCMDNDALKTKLTCHIRICLHILYMLV